MFYPLHAVVAAVDQALCFLRIRNTLPVDKYVGYIISDLEGIVYGVPTTAGSIINGAIDATNRDLLEPVAFFNPFTPCPPMSTVARLSLSVLAIFFLGPCVIVDGPFTNYLYDLGLIRSEGLGYHSIEQNKTLALEDIPSTEEPEEDTAALLAATRDALAVALSVQMKSNAKIDSLQAHNTALKASLKATNAGLEEWKEAAEEYETELGFIDDKAYEAHGRLLELNNFHVPGMGLRDNLDLLEASSKGVMDELEVKLRILKKRCDL